MHVEKNGYQRPLLGREDIAPADNEQGLGWRFIVSYSNAQSELK